MKWMPTATVMALVSSMEQKRLITTLSVRFRRIDTSRFCRKTGVEQGDFFPVIDKKRKIHRENK